MKRIAIISDIHGNLPALEAVVADFTLRQVDKVFNLGDSLSGPLLPLETARFLMAQEWVHLAGNHERQMINPGNSPRIPSDEFAFTQLTPSELTWVASLPTMMLYAEEIYVCHGTPQNDSDYLLDTIVNKTTRLATMQEITQHLGGITVPVVACGHTHVSRSIRSETGQLLINPGSVGLPAYDDTVPVCHAIETGSPDARYAILEKTLHGWKSELITVPYDHESMASLALKNGRLDWANALLTGYVT